MGFDTSSWLNSSGSSGSGSFFNSGSSGGSGLNGTEFTPKYWDSSSDPTPGSGSGSAYEWARKLPAGSDPFGLNKEKKESPLGDVARFAGDKLSSYAQSRYGQGGRSDGLAVGGGGGVSQSGDLTVVYPQSPTVIPAQGGGIGGKIGALAGAALMAPFTGGMSLGAAMGAIGGASALGGTAGSLFG
jgi:hypothetical protein